MAQLNLAVDRFEGIGPWLRSQLERILKGFIDKTQTITVTTSGTPDAEGSVRHDFGVVPAGYIVISRDKAAHIYDGTTAWTKELIYVRSDVATVVAKLMIF